MKKGLLVYSPLICGLCAITTSSIAESDQPSTGKDRVEFPKDYTTKFSVLRTVVRDDGAKLVTIYGNAAAASVTNRTQLPYPFGSVLVMETAGTSKNSEGKPLKDKNGDLRKEAVLGMHVMRKEKDFGAIYGEKRSGEWEFVEYKADGTFITPPQNSATCAECHIKAGAAKDFVYRGRFEE